MDELKLTSSAFSDGGEIPRKYGYEQENVSPPLKIENIPRDTKSLTLIMDDPDAMNVVIAGKKPFRDPYVHWVAYNISPFKNLTEMKVKLPNSCKIFESKPTSTSPMTKEEWTSQPNITERLRLFITEQYGERFCMLGVNGWDKFAYGGPAPPDKTHTYVFKLYALKIRLCYDEKGRWIGPALLTKADVEEAMKGPVTKGGHIIEETTLRGTYPKI